MTYRPDIEGLRAIAVLLVIGAHAQMPGLAAGFIGVDIFFVLSGFLITGLLVREHEAIGKLRLGVFYARRFRRLMPALALMLLVAGAAGALLLPPTEQSTSAIAGAAAALWISNLHFAFSDLDYFAPITGNNLFLHTWSLGVEEQFYLTWPALLLLSLFIFKRTGKPRLTAFLAALALASLLACLLLSPINANLAFYLMPTRAWQFALGGLVFLVAAQSKSTPDKPSRSKEVLAAAYSRYASAAGSVLLLLSLLLIDETTSYPGAWALLPSLATAALLWAGSLNQHDPVIYRLSHPTLQAIGRRSYSWYLWHWPILVFGAAVFGTMNGWKRVMLVMLSWLIADAAYRWFESPLRHKAWIIEPPKRAILGSFAVMAIVLIMASQWQQHADARQFVGNKKVSGESSLPVIYRMGCDQWIHSSELTPCEFGEPNAAKTVIVIGDSIGLQWFPALQLAFNPEKWRMVVLTKSACPMVDQSYYYPRIGRTFEKCDEWRDLVAKYVADTSPDMVVMGGSHAYPFTNTQWLEGSRRWLNRITPHAHSTLVIRSTPNLPFDGPSCLAPRSKLHEWLSDASRCTVKAANPEQDEISATLSGLIQDNESVRWIDLNDIVCPEGLCSAERNGNLVYRDSRHLDATFVVSISQEVSKRIGTVNHSK